MLLEDQEQEAYKHIMQKQDSGQALTPEEESLIKARQEAINTGATALNTSHQPNSEGTVAHAINRLQPVGGSGIKDGESGAKRRDSRSRSPNRGANGGKNMEA